MDRPMQFRKHKFSEFVKQDLESFFIDGVPDGFSFHFTQNILFYDGHWLKNSFRLYECIKRNKAYIVGSYIRVGGKNLCSIAAGKTRGKASDASLYRLYQKILQQKPAFFMPRNLLGYPNVVGHCYLISAVLPLLVSFPFLETLLAVNTNITLLRNSAKLARLVGKPYSMAEPPYLWSTHLYKLHRIYHKVSLIGRFEEHNVDILATRKSVKRSNSPVAEPAYVRPKSDLYLHNSLVAGLCTLLREYCDGQYSDAGGDEREAYRDIMWKVASEDVQFVERFFMKLQFSYLCRKCSGGPFTDIFYTPVIAMDGEHDFQTLLSRLDWLCKIQDFYCQRTRNVGVCGGQIRAITEVKLLNSPKVLCFLTSYGVDSIPVPEMLSLETSFFVMGYTRLCSSNKFKCWLDKDGEPYGPHFRQPVEGDTFECWHTYPTVKTTSGFIDVNNAKLFKCSEDLFGRTTGGTLHFYQSDEYDNHLPSIGSADVYRFEQNNL